MAGCIDLTREQIDAIRRQLRANRNGIRDEALFVLGCNTGFRISSLLALQVRHVVRPGWDIVDRIYIERRSVKRKKAGHEVALNAAARSELRALMEHLIETCAAADYCYLFAGPDPRRPIGRQYAYAIIHEAAKRAGISGKIGTHSMRKTYATAFYAAAKKTDKGDPLHLTQHALNHASIESTAKYLRIRRDDVDDLTRKIVF